MKITMEHNGVCSSSYYAPYPDPRGNEYHVGSNFTISIQDMDAYPEQAVDICRVENGFVSIPTDIMAKYLWDVVHLVLRVSSKNKAATGDILNMLVDWACIEDSTLFDRMTYPHFAIYATVLDRLDLQNIGPITIQQVIDIINRD